MSIVNEAVVIMEQARSKLIDEGVSPQEADHRVIANFDRIRQAPDQLTLNIQTLCEEL